MKIKFSKKFLSVILAALMVVTSIPIVTISASAADTAALESAITYYESKMDGFSSSNIYKNLLPAYNAYMAAREALKNPDSADLNTLESNLRSATDAMTVWSKPTYSLPTTQMFPGDKMNEGTYEQRYSQIVYVTQAGLFTGGSKNQMTIRLYVPRVVVAVWDGVNYPKYGIMPGMQVSNDTISSKTRGFGTFTTALTEDTDEPNGVSTNEIFNEVSLDEYFYCRFENEGALTSTDFRWINGSGISGDANSGKITTQLLSNDQLNSNPTQCKLSQRGWSNSNFMNIAGSVVVKPTFSANQYSKMYSGCLVYKAQNYNSDAYTWHGIFFGDNGNGSNTDSATDLRVINYAPVLSGITSFAQNIQSALTTNDGIEHYSQGGMTEIFTSLDAYTSDSLNPNNYSYTDVNTGVSQVSTAIGNTVNTYANAKVGNVDNCNIVFNYKDANGQDKTTSYQFRYNTAIAAPADVAQSYVSDDGQYTYTFTGWSPEFIATAKGDVTYTAQYSETVNLADFTVYDANVQALKDQLNAVEADEYLQYPYDKLAELNTEISSLKYWDEADRKDVFVSLQSDVDVEAEQIAQMLTNLGKTIETENAQTTGMNDDPDQYDEEAIALLQEKLITTVEVDGVSYEAVMYDDQTELDTAVKKALESAMTYTVYLNGEPVEELIDVPYGAHVIISGDGTVLKSEDAATGGNYSWSGFFAAPSYGESTEEGYNYNTSNERYLTTAPAYSFVVKGDSYLTAVSSSDESLSQVTVKNNVTGYISNIFYVKTGNVIGAELEQSHRNIAGYRFNGFYNASSGGTLVDENTVVEGDMTVYAQYTSSKPISYEIGVYRTADDFYNASNAVISEGTTYQYNDKIVLSADITDFYAWVAADTSNDTNITAKVISYNPEFTYYVCDSLVFFPMTRDEISVPENDFGEFSVTILNYDSTVFDVNEDGSQIFAKSELVPIYNGDDQLEKVSLVGSFAVPEGYEVLEKGFLIDYYNSGIEADKFTVTNDQLSRNKVIHLTSGENQFVLNVVGGGKYPIDYRAYAIVKSPTGERTEIYSTIVNADAIV